MQKHNIHIVATGPESSGKTTLVNQLKGYQGFDVVEEYSRIYLQECPDYIQKDLLEIAKGQLALFNKSNSELILSDTDLLTIKIWSEVKYGHVDESILTLFNANLADAYLLFRPDIPWEEDPLRESPNDRDELFEIYLKEIQNLDVPFVIIEGDRDTRIKTAQTFIDKLLLEF